MKLARNSVISSFSYFSPLLFLNAVCFTKCLMACNKSSFLVDENHVGDKNIVEKGVLQAFEEFIKKYGTNEKNVIDHGLK